MARPKKGRKVCSLPKTKEFAPINSENLFRDTIVMSVDEYETIRLIDQQNFSQEECSLYMKIARTSVQHIYFNARKKLAQVLVEGLNLKIEGGEIVLCDGKETSCGCGGCRKHKYALIKQREEK